MEGPIWHTIFSELYLSDTERIVIRHGVKCGQWNTFLFFGVTQALW